MKITFITGAGISKESGISTFRCSEDSNWNKMKPEDYATLEAWNKNRDEVIKFYDNRRVELGEVEPNEAHLYITKMQKNYEFEVNVITQNVDDLHERSGCENIIHLHGKLTEIRHLNNSNGHVNVSDKIEDIGYTKMKNRDFLRPNVVFFGEYPHKVNLAMNVLNDSDIIVIVGTSLSITYLNSMIEDVANEKDVSIYYIDPNPDKTLDVPEVNYIEKVATEGMKEFYDLFTQ